MQKHVYDISGPTKRAVFSERDRMVLDITFRDVRMQWPIADLTLLQGPLSGIDKQARWEFYEPLGKIYKYTNLDEDVNSRIALSVIADYGLVRIIHPELDIMLHPKAHTIDVKFEPKNWQKAYNFFCETQVNPHHPELKTIESYLQNNFPNNSQLDLALLTRAA